MDPLDDGIVAKPPPRIIRFLPKPARIPKQEPQPELPTPLIKPKEEVKPSFSSTNAATTSNTTVIETKPDEIMAEVEHTAAVAVEENPKEDDHMEEDKKEEEDSVIREIDVFFTPGPLDSNAELYVMQYPLRPSWRPYEFTENCKEVRIEPKSGKIEVDLYLENSKNYDEDAAANLLIKKQTLSSWSPPLTTSYAVGVLKGNKLHLNPVHAVVQLRPSMEHLTPPGLKKSAPEKVGKIVNPPAAQVTDAEESWILLDYHSMNRKESSPATRYRQKMTSQESSGIQFSMSPYEYVKSLCPASSTQKVGDRSLSKRSLLSLPLEERFRKWFSEGPQFNRFNALKHLAPKECNEDVLEVLQRHARLVQGLWVSKSSLLQLKNPLVRDYVLVLFKKNIVISRDDLTKLKIDEYRCKEAEGYLNLFAIYRPSSKDWQLKEPRDVSFITSYPDIVGKQEQLWENQEKKIMEALQNRKSGPAMKNPSRPGMNSIPTTSVNNDQGAKINVNEKSVSRPMTISDETREGLPKALETVLRKHNVCSLDLILKGLTEQGVSKADIPEIHSVLDHIAVRFCDVYILKSLGDQTLDPLRRVVIDLFCAKEPGARLKKADIVEAAKIQIKREINNKEYTQVMSELCRSDKGAWVLKSGFVDSKLNPVRMPNGS